LKRVFLFSVKHTLSVAFLLFQFLQDGVSKTGYAEYFLRPALPYLSRLLSDNHRFLEDAAKEYTLDENNRRKLKVIYNPCGILHETTVSLSKANIDALAARTPERRLRVLWAGRLDTEKRVDLLIDIVRNCSFADFTVYGQCVVDECEALPELPNLTYRGPFSSPLEMVANTYFDAFIFTSRWEGMPNILLELVHSGFQLLLQRLVVLRN